MPVNYLTVDKTMIPCMVFFYNQLLSSFFNFSFLVTKQSKAQFSLISIEEFEQFFSAHSDVICTPQTHVSNFNSYLLRTTRALPGGGGGGGGVVTNWGSTSGNGKRSNFHVVFELTCCSILIWSYYWWILKFKITL